MNTTSSNIFAQNNSMLIPKGIKANYLFNDIVSVGSEPITGEESNSNSFPMLLNNVVESENTVPTDETAKQLKSLLSFLKNMDADLSGENLISIPEETLQSFKSNGNIELIKDKIEDIEIKKIIQDGSGSNSSLINTVPGLNIALAEIPDDSGDMASSQIIEVDGKKFKIEFLSVVKGDATDNSTVTNNKAVDSRKVFEEPKLPVDEKNSRISVTKNTENTVTTEKGNGQFSNSTNNISDSSVSEFDVIPNEEKNTFSLSGKSMSVKDAKVSPKDFVVKSDNGLSNEPENQKPILDVNGKNIEYTKVQSEESNNSGWQKEIQVNTSPNTSNSAGVVIDESEANSPINLSRAKLSGNSHLNVNLSEPNVSQEDNIADANNVKKNANAGGEKVNLSTKVKSEFTGIRNWGNSTTENAAANSELDSDPQIKLGTQSTSHRANEPKIIDKSNIQKANSQPGEKRDFKVFKNSIENDKEVIQSSLQGEEKVHPDKNPKPSFRAEFNPKVETVLKGQNPEHKKIILKITQLQDEKSSYTDLANKLSTGISGKEFEDFNKRISQKLFTSGLDYQNELDADKTKIKLSGDLNRDIQSEMLKTKHFFEREFNNHPKVFSIDEARPNRIINAQSENADKTETINANKSVFNEAGHKESLTKDSPQKNIHSNTGTSDSSPKAPNDSKTIAGDVQANMKSSFNNIVEEKTSTGKVAETIPAAQSFVDKIADKTFTPEMQIKQAVKPEVKFVNLNELKHEITKYFSSGNQHMVELKINPKELGGVKILLDVSQNVVNARLDVENEQIKHLLNNHVAQLKESMLQQGLVLNQFNINYNNNFNKWKPKSGKTNPAHRINENEEINNDEFISERSTIKNLGYNSFDYIA